MTLVMACRPIIKFLFFLSLASLIGCASVVRNAKNPESIPIENLSVITTQIKGGNDAVIRQIDEETFISTWKVLLPPGRHTITLQQVGFDRAVHPTKTYQMDVLPRKHYDILFSGDGYMRDRDPALDSRFIGDTNPDYERLSVLYRGTNNEEIVPQSVIDMRAREAQLRRAQYNKDHAPEIARQKAKDEAMSRMRVAEESRQAETNARLVKVRGQRICRSVDGSIAMPVGQAYDGQVVYGNRLPTTYYITAFTENSTESKIQFRVSSVYRMEGSRLINVDKLGGETVYQTNAVMWDDPIAWSPCK